MIDLYIGDETSTHPTDNSLLAARNYIDNGLYPIPIPEGTKAPALKGWNALEITNDNVANFFGSRPQNIGIKLEASNLTDIDLDSPEAIRAAPHLLPATGAIFGRDSAQRSHWIYEGTMSSETFKDPVPGEGHKAMLLEIRSTGGIQTVFPPSIHPSGEKIRWENGYSPSTSHPEEIIKACQKLATASLLGRYWPDGARHEAAMSLAGGLKRADWNKDDAETFMLAVIAAAKDEESNDRLRAVHDTYENPSDKLTGFKRLSEIISPEIVKKVREWLGIGSYRASYEEVANEAMHLTGSSHPETIESVTRKSAHLTSIEKGKILSLVKDRTRISMGSLRETLKEYQTRQCHDLGLSIANETLATFFEDGEHLIRAADRRFWFFNGKFWKPITEDQISKIILSTIEEREDEVMGTTFAALKDQAMKLITAKCAQGGDAMNFTKEPPPAINCQNGELWINHDGSVDLKPHSPDSRLTYILNTEYDPDATAPLFEKTLHEIFEHSSDSEGMKRHIEEVIGYAIQPTRNIPCWLMLHGRGRDGKTKITETIEKLVNQRSVYSGRIQNVEKNMNSIGSLAGKLVLIDDDVDVGTKLPDGFLKKISERKLMTGALKYINEFDFVAICLPILLCNSFPNSADLSTGMRRRAHIVPFPRSFSEEEADIHRFEKIWDTELSGVLNLAIQGYQRVIQRERFDEPVDCIEARTRWITESNPLPLFIEERIVMDHEEAMKLTEFINQFRTWLYDEEYHYRPSRNTIKANLEALGYNVTRRSEGHVVVGMIGCIEYTVKLHRIENQFRLIDSHGLCNSCKHWNTSGSFDSCSSDGSPEDGVCDSYEEGVHYLNNSSASQRPD